jgi:hypothetical protein
LIFTTQPATTITATAAPTHLHTSSCHYQCPTTPVPHYYWGQHHYIRQQRPLLATLLFLYIIMSSTDSHIEKGFLKPILTPIKNVPTHKTIAPLEKEINSNAMSIPSYWGGGRHGHVAITITPAKYLALTEVAFDPPLNPGTTPEHPATTMAAQITKANWHFDAAQIEFQTFTIIEGLLKRQVLAAVNIMYINKLNDETVGFPTATCRGLLQYLRLHYGTFQISSKPTSTSLIASGNRQLYLKLFSSR